MFLKLENRVSRIAITAVMMTATLSFAGCTHSEQRTAGLTGAGALIGGAIGSQSGNAAAGAAIGAGAGLLLGLILDEIEREQIQKARTAAAHNGHGYSKSYRNSSGQRCHTASRVRSYESGGVRYREVTTTTSRDGKTVDTDTSTYHEVKTSTGKVDWE